MTEETKARIGCVCLTVFVIWWPLIASCIICDSFSIEQAAERSLACDAEPTELDIEQRAMTAFDVEPSEVIEPEYGAVAIEWDGMHTVIAESVWEQYTS